METVHRTYVFFSFPLTVLCLFVLPILCAATTWEVPGDFATIQGAIDSGSVLNGHEVIVHPGTYKENINFIGKSIVLRSTDPTSSSVVAATIIDGNNAGSVVTFSGTETASCVLSGFTITNGKAYTGGGINGNNSCASIQYNTIWGNSASWSGGGLAYCDGSIEHNTISGNSAVSGGLDGFGGGFMRCDGTIKHNTITGNSASHEGGGFAYCEGSIKNNTITCNSAPWGGGLFFSHGIIQNSIISDNSAAVSGGGLMMCHGTIQNNTITGNSASSEGGGLLNCVAHVINCIIANNTGYGIYESGYVNPREVKYCDVYGNSPADYYDADTATSYTGIVVNSIPGGLVHDCISSDPLLLDPGGGDFHLQPTSPCIDAGCTISLAQDFEGNPRPFDGTTEPRGDGSDFDIGADEYVVYAPGIRDWEHY